MFIYLIKISRNVNEYRGMCVDLARVEREESMNEEEITVPYDHTLVTMSRERNRRRIRKNGGRIMRRKHG
jgi:hypothetical protein